MKRLFCALLCILLCCNLLGCRQEKEEPILVPVEFFYPHSDFSYTDTQTILGSEFRESAGHESDMLYLLNQYLSGPKSVSLAHPFPKSCTVLSLTPTDDAVLLVISDKFAVLTGMELTVACVSLAKTVTGITGHDTVVIQAKTKLLDGKESITVQDGVPLLLDDYVAPSQPE